MATVGSAMRSLVNVSMPVRRATYALAKAAVPVMESVSNAMDGRFA